MGPDFEKMSPHSRDFSHELGDIFSMFNSKKPLKIELKILPSDVSTLWKNNKGLGYSRGNCLLGAKGDACCIYAAPVVQYI